MVHFETYEWNPDDRMLQKAADILKNNGIGIIPTDTVYAIICDINSKKGLEKLCKLQNLKPEKINLSIIFKDLKNISDYCQPFDTKTYKILKRHFPGPFTFILKANQKIPKFFPNNRKTIGIRIPDHKVTHALVHLLGTPMITNSVHSNDAILDYITDPYDILNTFEHTVDFFIDAGHCGNIPSTVVDLSAEEPILIREGKGELLM